MLQVEKILFVNTSIVKCCINSPYDFQAGMVNGHDFTLDFKLGFNLADKLVKADFLLEVTTKCNIENNIEEAKGEFHFVFVFHVENLDELAITDEKGLIELDGNLGNALAAISYSTARGIMLVRLKGTALEFFILPVIDPKKLLNPDIKA